MASIIYRREEGNIGILSIDATESEGHGGELQVTDHEVESGADVSDHLRMRPRTLRIAGIVTALPTGQQPNRMRPYNAWDALRHIQESRQLVTVNTTLELYDSLALVSVEAPRDRTTGDALRFTLTFREVRQVASETVTLPPRNRKAKAKTGDQPPKDAPEKAAEKGRRQVRGFKRLTDPLNRLFGLDP